MIGRYVKIFFKNNGKFEESLPRFTAPSPPLQGDVEISNFPISLRDGLVIDVSFVCEFKGSSRAPGGWNNGVRHSNDVLQARHFRHAPSAMDTDEIEMHLTTTNSLHRIVDDGWNLSPDSPRSPPTPPSPPSHGTSYENVVSNHEAYSLHLTENSLIATAVMKLNNCQPIDGDEIIQEGHECVICRTSRKTHVLVPCGHLCVCVNCAEITMTLSNACPICRKQSTSIMQVFVYT